MVGINDFNVETLQMTAWVSDGEISPSRTVRYAWEHLKDIFTSEPEFLPLDVPGEIPRLSVSNHDESIKLDTPRNRINLYRRLTPFDPTDSTLDIEAEVHRFSGWIEGIASASDAKIGRLGIVVLRTARAEHPAVLIAQRFLAPVWGNAGFSEPLVIELSALARVDSGDHPPLNSWARLKTGTRVSDPEVRLLILEQDVNIQSDEAEQQPELSRAEVEWFCKAATESVHSTFEKLFSD